MPNLDFHGRLKQLRDYIEEQESQENEYKGSVLRNEFDLDGEIDSLRAAGMPVAGVIEYIIAVNPVLWAQYWLRNPQNPSKDLLLFTHQKAILNCNSKYKLTRCGRQVGKTLCMAVDMLFNSMTNAHTRLLYVAPYLTQVKVLYEKTLMPLIVDVPDIANAIAKKPSHPYYQAIFKNGTEIAAMTAGTRSGQKGASIRGTSADKLYLDEVDFMGREAIAAIMAVMFARPDSKVWISSTPIGKREEFYHWATDPKSNFMCKDCIAAARMGSPFHYSSHISPLFTQEADDFYRRSMPMEQYAHEVLAEWGEESQGVFRHSDIDFCLSVSRRDVIIDPVNNISKQISYNYDELTPSTKCIYILGVDWNKETTGVQLCIIEYNPTLEVINMLTPHMYRIFRTEVITAVEFTEGGAVTRIMELERAIPISFIYADEGYGTIQIEALKNIALSNNRIELANKIVPINMSSSQEVYDPITHQKIKKPMKPFMVDNAARIVESRRILLPDLEDEKVGLVGQMREYVIIRRAASGHPVFSQSNEDMLTAFMLALLGFAREYSELIKVDSFNSISYSKEGGMAGRTANYIQPRWEEDKHKPVDLEQYGVMKREPLFREMAERLGYPYAYTTDGRPEESRPKLGPSLTPYESSMRGARTGASSTGRRFRGYTKPSGRSF